MKEMPQLSPDDIDWKVGNDEKDTAEAPNTASGRPTLRCYCCGTTYERGRWTCCAPASVGSSEWFRSWCTRGFKRNCPRHCDCPEHVHKRAVQEARQLGDPDPAAPGSGPASVTAGQEDGFGA